MTSAEFLRLYNERSHNLMWLLGAGASATSGIPTAGDLVWDFKRMIFCTEQKVSIRACQDLHDVRLQQKLQRHFDTDGKFPPLNTESEYAEFFSAAYPDEADRRRYIDRMVSQATASYGHFALAVLLALGKARIVWTTNFDKNVEDSAAKVFQTTAKLAVATLDSPKLADECVLEERWPLLVKLHGDFQSRRLKNTADELVKQDERLRRCLIETCKRFGIIVIGYSGRDNSVMEALEQAIDEGRGYPSGLFWICPPGVSPFGRANTLIEKAKAVGIQAYQIEANNFDEFMADLLLMQKEIPADMAQHLDSITPRVTDAPMPTAEGGWPVVRLNGLPVPSFPTICRRLVTDVGGMKDLRQVVKDSGKDILAVRRNVGVLAFGSDADIRAVFVSRQVKEWDLHSIEIERLAFESMEMSLLYDALVRSLVRGRSLCAYRRQGTPVLAINPQDVGNRNYDSLRQVTTPLAGRVPKVGIWWAEAISIRLELRQGRLWLLFEPTTWVDNLPDRRVSDEVKEFHRQRAASRYNQKWNQLLDAWSSLITGGQNSARLAAFGIADGVDAVFEINRTTAYSRRLRRA